MSDNSLDRILARQRSRAKRSGAQSHVECLRSRGPTMSWGAGRDELTVQGAGGSGISAGSVRMERWDEGMGKVR
jgi:hypothetical protein